MFTSLRRRMGRNCSDTWVVRDGLKPPAVDSAWVMCLVVVTMVVLCVSCLFIRSGSSGAKAQALPTSPLSTEVTDRR